MRDLRERMPRLDVQGLVPPLEGPPAFAAVPIEPVCPRPLQVLHPGAQIRLRRLHRQMKMIAHDHVRVDPPAEALSRFLQRAFKSLRRSFRSKYGPAIIATVDDVITRPLVLQSQRPRHAPEACKRIVLSIVKT